jgi:hypothetical protein
VTQFDPEHYSSRYKRALAVAVLLFLATLTASILIAILSTSNRRSLQEDHEMTLTAVVHDLSQTLTAGIATPTTAPVPQVGVFPFALEAGGPTYHAAEPCDRHVLTGSITDQDGQPLNGIKVWIWADYGGILTDTLRSGYAPAWEPAIGPGEFVLTIPDMINRRVWVQLVIDERFVSAPVEIVFEQDDCAHNQADVAFRQIETLE